MIETRKKIQLILNEKTHHLSEIGFENNFAYFIVNVRYRFLVTILPSLYILPIELFICEQL